MTHPILAIDHGDARIGLAATDELGIGTHPVETIDCRKSEPIPRILEIIHERKIAAIVLGLPLRMDGSGLSRGVPGAQPERADGSI